MKRICALSALLLTGMAIGLKAQDVRLFTSKEGLSNSGVRVIYEDSRNNIWITTQNGLNRYDGVKMNVYRHRIGDPASLLHDETTYVCQYDENHLLVGTVHGLQTYDYATDKFTDLIYLGERGDTISARVTGINRLPDNRFFASFAGFQLAEIRRDEDGNLSLSHTGSFDTEEHAPIQMLEDGKKRLWIVNSNRNLFLRQGGKERKFQVVANVRKIAVSSTGTLYAATENNGLYAFDEKTGDFRQVASGEEVGGVIYGFNPWTNGRMFVCTDGAGLRIYDERTHKITQSPIKTNEFNLENSNVKDAICDSFGNVWVGIYWRGVMMKPTNQSAFEYIGQRSITKNTIGNNSVFAVVPGWNDDGVWVAADNDGLYHISTDGTSAQHWGKENHPQMPRGFTEIAPLSPSALLLGTFSDGLWQMQDGSFSLLTRDINQIFDIKPADKQGCYWIATVGNGFFYYDHNTRNYTSYKPDWNQGGRGADIIGNPYVLTLLPVGRQLFLGTADGVTISKLDADNGIRAASKKILPGKYVHHFVLSAAGEYVWAATNAGLIRIDVKSHQTKIYTTEDGLPVNNVESLCTDGELLWIGTDVGLSCMDAKREVFTNYFAADGLQDNEFSAAATARVGQNLYFGGVGGITYFNTEKIRQWQSKENNLHLRLVDVLVGGRTVHQGDRSGRYQILEGLINETESIELCHSDNHFTIELGVPELSNQDVTYEYSLNGGKWNNQGSNNNRLVFNNLEAGTYKVRVRARAMGQTSEERTFTAVVHPAWYASTAAKLFYLVLLLALCWFVYEYVKRRMQARKVLARQRQQEELNEARIQFFMNISHEIRTPMTLILSPLDKLISSDPDATRQHNYQLIRQNSDRILRLVNQMMDARKIEQGKFLLRYTKVEMVGFLHNLFDVFASNAKGRDIDFRFTHNVDEYEVFVDAGNMDKVVMNLLSNAFKFTPDGGKITLALDARSDDFDISLTDSGCGIPDEDKPKVFDRFYSVGNKQGYVGTGIGLNLTSMLVGLHKGTIRVEDSPEGQGTRFVVSLPKGDESLMEGSIVPDRQADPVEHEIAELLPVEKPADTHRKNALLVEDDEAIRQYVHSELSKELLIHTAANGQEAWDYVVAHPGKVDVIISDIMMPVMDGLTLCQKIKSNFNTNHIPVVLMTALGADSDRIAGLTNGADAYVTKPFNIDVLRTVVLQQLKTRQLLQGKYHGDRQQQEKIDKVEVESPDENLMRRVMKVINGELANPELSVEMIADKVGISRVHFYRKMKDLTGQAPRDYLKYVRLKEAARLLQEKKMDITGVSIATGFKSLSAFSTNFKSLFGLSPTEWAKKKND